MAGNDTAVETEKLTRIYGSGNTEVVAMRDVTLCVRRGEVVALLGPSGAGKSTLLTAVGLINPPTSGRVLINGRLVMEGSRAAVDLTAFRRNHIGFVFQKSNLIPFLSAVENVRVALEINGWPAGRARHGRWSCSNTSTWPTGPETCPACCPAASSSGWPSPVRWPTDPV